MITSKHNQRRLLFAIAFTAINIISLPSRIKSGFYLQGDTASGTTDVAGLSKEIRRNAIKIGAPWTDTYSPNHSKENNVRISFRLHDPEDVPRPDKFLSVDNFICKDRADLPPSLGPSDKGRLFDFTTTVSTNLNILFMGDSLGHQFSQGFEAAVLGPGYEHIRKIFMQYTSGKHFDQYVVEE